MKAISLRFHDPHTNTLKELTSERKDLRMAVSLKEASKGLFYDIRNPGQLLKQPCKRRIRRFHSMLDACGTGKSHSVTV